MDERMAQAAKERALAIAATDNAVAADVQDGIHKALTTRNPNPFAMTFEGEVGGKKVISAYVKKAGRSVMLNEVAKKKGGLALLRSICVRSCSEDPKALLDMLTALPSGLQRGFLESRDNDYRALTMPRGFALYKFVVIFGNGEKWQGEGIAHIGNVRSTQLHSRLDEMAETRAFMRCVGRGLADGFISPEQAAGSEDLDAAERELLAEDEAMEAEAVERTEAGPDGSESFRASDGGGTSDSVGGAATQGDAETDHPAQAGAGEADGDDPFLAGSQASEQPHGTNPSAVGGESARNISVGDLMELAKQKGVFLLGEVKRFGKTKAGDLTAEEREILYGGLSGMPDKASK